MKLWAYGGFILLVCAFLALVVVAKTDPSKRHDCMSLILVEEGTPGFERGRNLEKIGLRGQDTSELFFDDVRVPAENLLGMKEGQG